MRTHITRRDMVIAEDHTVNGIGDSATPVTDRSSPDSDTTETRSMTVDALVEQEGTLTRTRRVYCPQDLWVRPLSIEHKHNASGTSVKRVDALYFVVIYIADCHRFHSPAAWVVEKHGYFMGMYHHTFQRFDCTYFSPPRRYFLGLTLNDQPPTPVCVQGMRGHSRALAIWFLQHDTRWCDQCRKQQDKL